LSAARPLNLFYEEPDPDRWLPYDRHLRRVVRRVVRGPAQPGGAERAFLNLVAGLDRLGTSYRINDYRHLAAHPGELACVFGKPHVLEKIPGKTPLLFGTSIYSHPNDDPKLPERRLIRQVLVPSPWVQRMFAEVWPDIVSVWPAGIDTERWAPGPDAAKDVDVLIYDKIFWQRAHYEETLIGPLRQELGRRGLRVETLRYGSYRESDLLAFSRRARSMVYLSRHETQGIAAQQMLSSGVPLFAWDKGGLWQDPKYAPHQVRFGPVTSVPFWDDRCGVKFRGGEDLAESFDRFWLGIEGRAFAPRQMILKEFTLEKRSQAYVELAEKYG
jgi:glycosyltransferase involved in cell wall biosynthesis